jgi:hypothetical protein
MSAELQFWRCGHPRTPENTTGQAKGQCRQCHRANYWNRTPEERRDDYRIRMLPIQLERARRRVRQLEAEAERYGFRDLLRGGEDAKKP